MVRLAENKDIERILKLLIQVNNVHAALRPDLFIKDKTKYNKEALEEIIRNPMTPIFVSVDKDDVVKGYGFAQINNIGGEDNLQSYSNIYIDDICVDEAFRHQGVATEIYKFIEGYAEGMGCHNITLNVWEGNDSARRFYESMGMGIQKTVMEKIL